MNEQQKNIRERKVSRDPFRWPIKKSAVEMFTVWRRRRFSGVCDLMRRIYVCSAILKADVDVHAEPQWPNWPENRIIQSGPGTGGRWDVHSIVARLTFSAPSAWDATRLIDCSSLFRNFTVWQAPQKENYFGFAWHRSIITSLRLLEWALHVSHNQRSQSKRDLQFVNKTLIAPLVCRVCELFNRFEVLLDGEEISSSS